MSIMLRIGDNEYPTYLDRTNTQRFKNVESEEFVKQYEDDTTLAILVRTSEGRMDQHTALRIIASREYSIYYVMELPLFAKLEVHNPEWDAEDSAYWKQWRQAISSQGE